jgi:hypothetical protein
MLMEQPVTQLEVGRKLIEARFRGIFEPITMEDTMGRPKIIVSILGFIAFLFFVSCSTSDPATTAFPPTSDPISFTPIPTFACEVECLVDTKGYIVEITCESGQTTVTYGDSTKFQDQTIELQLNQTRVYENSGNKYEITGSIFVDETAGEVEYSIAITGGVFGDTPQICEE